MRALAFACSVFTLGSGIALALIAPSRRTVGWVIVGILALAVWAAALQGCAAVPLPHITARVGPALARDAQYCGFHARQQHNCPKSAVAVSNGRDYSPFAKFWRHSFHLKVQLILANAPIHGENQPLLFAVNILFQ